MLYNFLLCIFLAGDVATNPGPCSSLSINRNMKCFVLNARSLSHKFSKINDKENDMCSNMGSFENLVYASWGLWLSLFERNLDERGHSQLRNSEFYLHHIQKTSWWWWCVESSSFKSVREIQHNCNIEISVAELTVVSNIEVVANEDQSWMIVHSITFSVTFPLTIHI